MTFSKRYSDEPHSTVSVRYTDDPIFESGSSNHNNMDEAGKEDDYSFQVRHSLPAPQELQTDLPRRSMTKRTMGLIAAAVFLFTAIIGLSVALAARNSNNNVDAVGGDGKKDLTPGDEGEFWDRHPDQDLTQRFQDVANYMNRFAYTDLKTMTTQGTPQYKAVRFMADQDPAELEVPASTDYDSAMDFVQRFVLVVFYYSTNGDAWENQLKFLSDFDVCAWNEQIESSEEATVGNYDGWLSGVQCNSDGEINYFFIPNNNLSGKLPVELGLLQAMMHFSVFGNEIKGNFPDSLQEWVELKLMAVESNMMSGPLPAWMGAWTEMEYLALGANVFSGSLPDGVFDNMPDLIEVSLHDNNLSGSFDKFNENTALDTLLMQRNSFTGEIQEDTFLNVPLRVLDMNTNNIGGQIPYDFYDVPYVALHHNKITGSLPEPQYEHPIKFLSVYGNQMTGALPQNLGDLPALVYLDLSQNRFDSAIPESIGECTRLRYLYLGDNEFSTTFQDLSALASLVYLKELSLRNMGLTGPFPDFVGAQLTSLIFLDLRDNELTDSLPTNIQNLQSMRFMLLSNNLLMGDVPNELASLEDLRVLALDNNSFTNNGDIGEVCGENGPEDLVWLSADDSITCSCCTERCSADEAVCGGSTLLSPNIDYGYERLRFVFNAQLIFDLNTSNDL